MWGWFTAAKSKTAPVTTAAKREIRVFVSSTFRDLRDEREYLVKHIFPQVRARCEERAVGFVEVDLRWGITDEQAQGDGALEICLAEIEQCLPFFIGLLGERYGWVPASLGKGVLARHPWLARKRGRSITELEFLHRLRQTRDLRETIFFYFRDPDVSKRLTEEQAQGDRNKLAALKKLVRKSGLPVRESFASPQALGEWVLADLMRALDHHFPAKAANDWLSAEMARQLAYAARQTEVFFARERIVRAVSAHSAKGGPLLLEGPSGIGKSTLLAHVAVTKSADLVLAAFAAATPVAGDLDTMLQHLAAGLKQALGLQRDLPENSIQLRREFGAWLDDAASALRGQKLVLIVDGVDQLLTGEGVRDVSWIPSQLPAGVSLLLSASDDAIRGELRRRGIAGLEVTAWDERERLALAERYLAQFAKTLPRNLLREIVKAPSSERPLFLRTLLEELRRHAEHETLAELTSHYLAAGDTAGLYHRILERYERDYERERPNLVRDAMRCLAAARNGLAEHELLSVLGEGEQALPHAFWSPLYLALGGAFVDRGDTLRFAHRALRDAVEQRYFKDESSRRETHAQLARFFGSQSSRVLERRRLEELAWQLARAGDWTRLGEVLAEPTYLVRAWERDRPDLLMRLGEWARGTNRSIVELFAPVVAAPGSYSMKHAGVIAQILVRGADKRAGIALQDHLIERSRAGGDRHDLAVALNNRALMADDEGDHARALALRDEQRRVLEGKEGSALATALVNQARSYIAQGQPREAEPLLVEALAAGKAGDWPHVLAFACGMQADLARQRGDFADARAKYEQAESYSRRARHLPGIIEANIAFAEMAAAEKNFAEADARLKTAADIAAESGDAIHEGQVHAAAGRVAAERGDPGGAVRSYDRAIAAYERAGAKHLLSETMANKGMVLIVGQRFEDALSVLGQAETLARVTGDTRSLMQVLLGMGAVNLELGENAKAYEFFAAQAKLARAQNHYPGLRAALGNMAIAAARLGDGAAAIRALDEEIALCLAHGDVDDAEGLRRTRESILTG